MNVFENYDNWKENKQTKAKIVYKFKLGIVGLSIKNIIKLYTKHRSFSLEQMTVLICHKLNSRLTAWQQSWQVQWQYLLVNPNLEDLVVLQRFGAEHQPIIVLRQVPHGSAIVIRQTDTVPAFSVKHRDHELTGLSWVLICLFLQSQLEELVCDVNLTILCCCARTAKKLMVALPGATLFWRFLSIGF